jgi:small subunit ribosomal protein S3
VGQKVHPIGFRLGVIKGWDSNWYGGKNYGDKLLEDHKIRNYIALRMPKAGIARVVIERTIKRLIITIHTARPGIVIGKGGQEVERLKEEIKRLTDKDVQINIYEIKRPDLDAKLVADNIAQQLEARISFRRAMKQALGSTMRANAEGIKIICSGRLGGAEMARTEQYKEGRVPLHTLRADIDYATSTAKTVYGSIGIKVWIFRGELYGKVDLSPNIDNQRTPVGTGGGYSGDRNDRRNDRGGDRRGGGGGGGGGDRRGGGGSGAGGGGGNRNRRGGGGGGGGR